MEDMRIEEGKPPSFRSTNGEPLTRVKMWYEDPRFEHMTLSEYLEVECPKCRGTGKSRSLTFSTFKECRKCKGTGVLK